ncbi:MAG: glycosyltransferase family 9 protein [Gemmatimonadaceae bacterium]
MQLRRLELWWRRQWIRILVRSMRRPADAKPDWSARPMRVLFLRHDRVGDMIVSTGVMRGIARSHDTITLDVLASPANAVLLDGADYLSDVVVFDKKRISSYLPTALRLRRAGYDAVIDCMVTAPSVTTLLLILASGARHRIGIAGRGNDAAFNVTVPGRAERDVHMVDRLAALARAFDVELSPAARAPVLTITDAERDRAEREWNAGPGAPRVLVNVSAGSSERRWPDERYSAVIRHIVERHSGAVVRVIASPSDASRATAIATAIARDVPGGDGAFVATPRLRDAIALVATADFVFTPDTSIAHAASAFTRPAVAIYARGKKSDWALYGTLGESIEHSEPDLSGLPLEPVLRAVDRVLSEALAIPRG